MTVPLPAKRRFALVAVALAGCAGAATWVFREPPVGPIYDGPMVQLLRPDGFTLTWRAQEPQGLEVRLRGDSEDAEVVVPVTIADRCRASVAGLRPASRYRYTIRRCGHDGAVLAEGQTRTAPERGGPFRFLAFGDSGSGNRVQYRLGSLMSEYDADVAVHTGDIVYPDGALQNYRRKFFLAYGDLLRRTAIYPTLGNHDVDDNGGEGMFRNFELPSNGPPGTRTGEYYWFDIGDVRFVCLNSNTPFQRLGQGVAEWLNHVLGDAADRWKVLYFHHPLYTSGDHTARGSFRQIILPVLDRWHAELVLVGHNHAYERSRPLRAGQVVGDGEGTVYITTGAGGGNLHRLRMPFDGLAARNDAKHSFTVVDVTSACLTVRQVAVDREELDRFEIHRSTTERHD